MCRAAEGLAPTAVPLIPEAGIAFADSPIRSRPEKAGTRPG